MQAAALCRKGARDLVVLESLHTRQAQVSQLGTRVEKLPDTVQREIDAVTQMHTLERYKLSWHARFLGAGSVWTTCQRHDANIGQVLTLDQANPPQFGQTSEMTDTSVCESGTTGKVNVSNSVALLDKFDDSVIAEEGTMTQVDVVQIFSQGTDGLDCLICDELTLGKNKIS